MVRAAICPEDTHDGDYNPETGDRWCRQCGVLLDPKGQSREDAAARQWDLRKTLNNGGV